MSVKEGYKEMVREMTKLDLVMLPCARRKEAPLFDTKECGLPRPFGHPHLCERAFLSFRACVPGPMIEGVEGNPGAGRTLDQDTP
jgi:hypothetical protein